MARGSRANRQEADTTTLEMSVSDFRREPRAGEAYAPVTLVTSRGEIETRYYAVPNATRGVILVGGAGGGFDTPVRGRLYPRLCETLQQDGIAALRVKYRYPNDLEECTLDVLAGTAFLEDEGVRSIGLVGHSFGGAVVIQAAAFSDLIKTCVPMSTQTYGAGPAAELGPRCSLLLLHGQADEALPPSCSEYVHSIAREPKKIILKKGARHGLDEWSDELPLILRDWFNQELAKDSSQKRNAHREDTER